MNKLRVALVGLGKIGQDYDYQHMGEAVVITHAQAFSRHSAFELVAGIDPNMDNRQRFTAKFHAPAFATLNDFQEQVDIFVIATPTASHSSLFRQIILKKPRAVLCEKPLSLNIPEAQAMVNEAERLGVPLLVNYMRRFEPGILCLKGLIDSGGIGEVYKGTVWYSKGVYNNGSHFVDLIQFLLGPAETIHCVSAGRLWEGRDPEPDFVLKTTASEIYFLAAREENFSLAEFELIGTRGRIRYLRGGELIEHWQVTEDPTFPGYLALSEKPAIIPNDFLRYQWHVADHLAAFLDGRSASLNSTGATSIGTLRLIASLA